MFEGANGKEYPRHAYLDVWGDNEQYQTLLKDSTELSAASHNPITLNPNQLASVKYTEEVPALLSEYAIFKLDLKYDPSTRTLFRLEEPVWELGSGWH